MIRFIERRKHDRLRTLLSSYIDGEVSEKETREVEQHLAQCSECAAEIESLKSTSNLLKMLPQLQAPRSFVLREAPMPARRAAPMMWTSSLATSVAALLLVVLLMGDLLGFITQSETTSQPFAAMEAPEAPRPAPAAPAPAAAPEPEAFMPFMRSVPRQAAQPAPGAPAAAPEPAQPQQPTAPAMPQQAPAATHAPGPAPTAETQEPAIAAAAPAPSAEPTPSPAEQGIMMTREQAPEDITGSGYGPTGSDTQTNLADAQETSPDEAPSPAVEPGATPSPPVAAARSLEPTEETAADKQMEAVTTLNQEPPPQARAAEPSAGVELPLRQLEIGIGALLAALILVTAWMAWRRAG